MNANRARVTYWLFIFVAVTWGALFSSTAADVKWHITQNGSPIMSFSLDPVMPNTTNIISFIAPADGNVYPNSCLASIAKGEPLIAVDSTNQVVNVTFTPPLTNTVCPEIILPVSGVDGRFGPLKSGAWVLKAQQNSYSFSVAEVPLSLSIQTLTNSVSLQLSWPVSGDFLALESKDSLSPTNWRTETNVPVVSNGQNLVRIPASSGSQFYRLRRLP